VSKRQAAAKVSPQRAAVPHSVRAALHTPGETLDAVTRQAMESRFNFDFRHIRVHRDERAAEAASDIGAEAFTAGRHIVFGAGRYAPRTPLGQAVLAHELAHSSPVEHRVDALRLGGVHDPEEAQAERAMRQPVTPHGDSAPVVRRWIGVALAMNARRAPEVEEGPMAPIISGSLRPHLETTTATTLIAYRDTPLESSHQLPEGTRLIDITALTTDREWMTVRVTTGPSAGLEGWVRRSDVAPRPMTEVLAPEEAVQLWGELSRATFRDTSNASVGPKKPIPFHYPVQDCEDRAFRMDQILEEAGYRFEGGRWHEPEMVSTERMQVRVA